MLSSQQVYIESVTYISNNRKSIMATQITQPLKT